LLATLCWTSTDFAGEKGKVWTDKVEAKFTQLSKHLGEKKFLVGEAPTLVDIHFYELCIYVKNIWGEEIKGLTNIAA